MRLLLIGHAAATLMMVGVIWMVQIVHYPLFSLVGSETYTRYQLAHVNAITLLVGPLMLIEAFTALLLLAQPPAGVPAWLPWAGIALVGVVWAVTMFVSVPQHNALAVGFRADVHQALVATNWIRTLAWTARGALVVAMLAMMRG